MSDKKRKRKTVRRGTRTPGRISIVLMVLILLVVMSVQIVKLKEKDSQFEAQEKVLKETYEEETQRSEEIKALADYMQTDEYIEDVAKSKLGLAYKDEIIFKQKED